MSASRASLVAYLRVSTARQGSSGLGLEAQRAAVQAHAAATGQRIVAEFVEVESGKKNDRPQLNAALAACRLHRATLCIAKLDRLARNVHFVSGLMEAGTDFVACDMPAANRLTLHFLAAIAEHEAAAISHRTKVALAAAKARGTRLGNPNGAAAMRPHAERGRLNGLRVRQARAVERATSMRGLFDEAEREGAETPTAIARFLNMRRIPSPSGAAWYPEQVRRALAASRPACG